MADSGDFQLESLVIDEATSGKRLDVALSLHPKILTRSKAAKLIEQDLVCIDDFTKKLKASTKVSEGMKIHLSIPIDKDVGLVAKDIPIDIVFEDKDIIIVNKASGMVVHPSSGHEDDTLVNALMHHTNDLAIGLGENRPGIVHRIDKDTSGILVVAKNDPSQLHLQKQFENKTNKRVYWCICFGIFKEKSGIITTNIGRHPVDRKRMAVLEDEGKLATTHYEVIGEFKKELSLVKVQLETGRTHQIRVHMKHLGYPIIGDWTYCNRKRMKSIESVKLRKMIDAMGRFALHASVLGFNHPSNDEYVEFKANIPDNLRELTDFLSFTDIIERDVD